jgi:hypothetical protein
LANNHRISLNMSTVITVDLTKEPDVAALTADMQPGAHVYGCFTIKSRTDQTLELRISDMAATCDELPEESDSTDEEDAEDGGDDEEAEGEPADAEKEVKTEAPAKKLARQLDGGDMMEY